MKIVRNNQSILPMKHLSNLIVWPLLLAGWCAYPGSATAQTEYWDPSNTHGTGSGGAGTWSSGTPWFNGTSDIAWPSGGTPNFGGTAGSVALGANETANGLTFATTGYTISAGSTLTLGGTTPTISIPSGTTTINCIIAGSGGLTYSGSGTLVLGGVDTYTGGTTISGGTLQIAADTALGNSSGGVTLKGGGTLLWSPTSGQLVENRAFSLGTGGGAMTLKGAYIYMNGTITGGGGITAGGGDMILQPSGQNSIGTWTENSSGRLFIATTGAVSSSDTLAFTASGVSLEYETLASASPTCAMTFVSGTGLDNRMTGTLTLNTANATFPSSGTMIFNNDSQASGAIVVNGNYPALSGGLTIQVGGGGGTPGSLTLNGVISGAQSLTKTQPGTLILGNAGNSYSGGTIVTGGILQVPADGELGNSSAGITLSGGGEIKFANYFTEPRAITLGTGGGVIAGSILLTGNITGGTSLSGNNGDLVLQPTGNNNFSTLTDTTASRVFLSSAGALGTTGSLATVNMSTSGSYLIFENTATTSPANTMSFASGTILAARSTVSGPLTVTTVAGGGGVTFPASGTMIFNADGDNVAMGAVVVNGNYPTLTGNLTIQMGSTLSTGALGSVGSATLNGAINGSYALTVTAPGSARGNIFLDGTNGYTGNTTNTSGGLTIGGSGALGGGVYAGNISIASLGLFTNATSANQTWSGIISGAGMLNQSGSGTLTLTGVNTYTGGTTITGGILDGNVAGSIPAGSVTVNGGTLQLDTPSSMSTGVILNLTSSPSNGAVNLNFTGTQNILALNFGSTSSALGSWGAIGSTASNQSAAFTGNGILNITGQNAYWDVSQTGGAGSGGTGSWDSSTVDWYNGSLDVTWPVNNVAFFEGTAGTVTLNASETADGLTFTTPGYSIIEGSSSPALTLAGTTPTISVPSGTTTIGCTLAGSGGLTENGSGSLILNGTNTYTGMTTIGTGGTLTISGAGELGSGTYAGNIAINGALTNATSVNQTWSGAISGAGSLIQNGPGQLLLTGASSYSGGTIVSNSTLVLTGANDGALGNASGGLTLSGGTLYWSNNATSYGPVVSRTITLGASGGEINVHNTYPYLNGPITGGTGLTVTGDDVILQSSANNVIGTLTEIGNRLFIGTVPASYSVSFNITGVGGLLCFEGTATNSPVNSMSFASGTCLDNRLIGSSGATNLIVSTANAVFPAAGTMIFNNDSQGPGTAPIVINGNYPVLTGNLTIQVGSSSPAGSVTLNGAVSGSYGLTKTLNGTLVLAAADSYTGGTTNNAGILDGNAPGSIPGDVTMIAGTLQLDSATAMSSAATLNLPATPAAGAVNLTFSGTQTIGALNFGTTSMAAGTWGAVGSGASHQNAGFVGSGLLNVTGGGTNQTINFPNPGTQTYGVAPIILTASASSGLSVTYSVSSGPATVVGNTLTITGAGSVTVQANQAGNNTYNPALPASQTFTVSPAALTITANTATKNYGTALTLGTSAFSASGLVSPDTVTAVTLAATGGTAATDPVSGSPYTITPSAASGTFVPANYTITYITNSLIVNPLTVILNATQAYDSTTNVYASTLTVSNAVSGDDVSLTNGPGGMTSADIGTNAITSLGTLALAGTTAGNYSMTSPSGAVVVTPLPVTLIGSRLYDGTNDASSSILTIVTNYDDTNLTLSGSATLAGSDAGTNGISDFTGLALGGSAATNYTLTGASGSVTITTVPLTITANPVSKTYGTAITLDPTAFTVSGSLVGSEAVTAVTMTATPVGPAATDPVGIDTVTPSAAIGTGGFLAANYNISYITNSLTVNPLAISLSGGSRPYDGATDADSSLLTVANNIDGANLTLSGSAVLASASVGVQAITSVGSLTLGGSAAGNYTLAGATLGTMTITNPFNPINAASALDNTGTNFVVTWASVPGVVYNVLTNSSLNPPVTWAAAGSVTATNTTTSFTLPGGITGNTNVNVVIQQ